MFLQKVKESTPKDIVITHLNVEVQIIWGKFISACKNSSAAEIKANSLLQYITSMKFDDGKWRGSSKSFIINWCDQLHGSTAS